MIAALAVLCINSVSLSASADFCAGLGSEFGDFIECSEEFTTFSKFQGGLEAPETQGYDPSLTQTTDARSFVKNIANFALGFLGLAAILIIIYSGFLYVTSAVNSDGVENAKNNIKYSVIGILVVLGSFAFVNTILTAPGGGSGAGGGGAGFQSDSTNAAQLANYNSAADEVKKMSVELVRAYEIATDDVRDLNKIMAYAPTDFTSRAQFAEYLSKVKSHLFGMASKRGGLSETGFMARAIADNIIDPALSTINGIVREERLNELQTTVGQSGLENFFDELLGGIGDFLGEFGSRDSALSQYMCSLPISERPVNYKVLDCKETGTDPFKTNIGTQFDDKLDRNLEKHLLTAIQADFSLRVADIVGKLHNIKTQQITYTALQNQFTALLKDLTGTGDFEIHKSRTRVATRINESWWNETGRGGDLENWTDWSDDTDFNYEETRGSSISGEPLQKIRTALEQFKNLYQALVNLRFTSPVITASVISGTAPLIVNFDASKSYDPSNESVIGEHLTWDLDGNGLDETDELCDDSENNVVFTTCTYKDPGNYRVALKLQSTQDEQDEGAALPGIAYLTIRVLPQSTKIQLTAQLADQQQEITLRRYVSVDDTQLGKLAIDVDELFVTTSEARAGITLDATETKSDREIVNYKWNFSDEIGSRQGTQKTSAAPAEQVQTGPKITKTFDKTGIVNAILEVEDSAGTTDRKIFKIVVSDHVPRIRSSRTAGNVRDEFVLDASGSSSAMGLFQEFRWIVDGTEVGAGRPGRRIPPLDIELPFPINRGSSFEATELDDAELLKISFDTPGDKKIELLAFPQGVDAGNRANAVKTELTLNVIPRDPIADIQVLFADESNPSLVSFSAENSEDGDRALFGQTVSSSSLINKWKVVNAQLGKQFVAETPNDGDGADGFIEESGDTLNGDGTNLVLRFLEEGRYTVLLETSKEVTVQGQPKLFTDVAKKTIEINSVVDLNLEAISAAGALIADPNLQDPDVDPAAAAAPTVSTSEGLVSKAGFVLTSNSADKVQVFFGDGTNEIHDFVELTDENSADLEARLEGTEFTEALANLVPAGEEPAVRVAVLTHEYRVAGTYNLRFKAFKGSDSLQKEQSLVIAEFGEPVAVVELTDQRSNRYINPGPGEIELFRKQKLRVSAARSLNSKGLARGLRFNWDTGDGRIFTSENFDLSYEDLNPDGVDVAFELTLTVTDEKNLTQLAKRTVKVKVNEATPTIDRVSVTKLGKTTPFTIIANAVGAEDLDGKIDEFRFELEDTTQDAGEPNIIVISSQPRASIVVPTRGDTDEEVNWKVLVQATDNDGNKSNTLESEEFQAINGLNELPKPGFSVDRTSVTVGEDVQFFNSATDADGEIVSVQYDLNGNNSFIDDGFGNNARLSTEPNETFSFAFNKKSPASGFKIKQLVIDDKGSRAVSRPVTIFVDSTLSDPVAAFESSVEGLRVTLRDQSTVDVNGGASQDTSQYRWDKDINTDSSGDGISDNDIDSTDINPIFDYDRSGKFRIKLTLEDLEGNTDSVINSVQVGGNLQAPVSAFVPTIDGLVVNVDNKSRADVAKNGFIRSFAWDFDLSKDSDGDGRKDNDLDSDEQTPVIEFTSKGLKKIRLTVTDSEGNEDSVINTVTLGGKLQPPVAAYLFETNGLTVEFSNNSRIDTANGGSLTEIKWDLNTSVDSDGDGNPKNDVDSRDPNFSHTYDFKGRFGVAVTVVDSEGNAETVERFINVGADVQAAVPAFLFSVDKTVASFENTSRANSDKGVSIESFVWDFDLAEDSDGDGEPDNDEDSTSANPGSHDYEVPGVYRAKLTIKDSLGNLNSISKNVTIRQKETLAPKAAFLHSSNQLQVSFINNSAADTANQVEVQQFIWDFDLDSDADGDGNSDNDAQSNEKNPSVSYPTAGNYRVSLTVIDSAGKVSSVIKNITVTESTANVPVAAFTHAGTGLLVNFNNNSTADRENGARMVEHIWDFDTQYDSNGDGAADNDEDSNNTNAVHSYPSSGVYEVKLTVIDSFGKTDSVSRRIRVEALASSAATTVLEQTNVYNQAANSGNLVTRGEMEARSRIAQLEAELAALQATVVDDPASAALPAGVSAAQRQAQLEQQRQSQIQAIQDQIRAQQERQQRIAAERDDAIREIQRQALSQQINREGQGLQTGLQATTRRVLPLEQDLLDELDTPVDSGRSGLDLSDFADLADLGVGGIGGDDSVVAGDEILNAVGFDPQDFIVSSPSINQDDRIILNANTGRVRFSFSHLPAYIETVIIDENIFRDTNSGTPGSSPDGTRNNDVDYVITDLSKDLEIEFSVDQSPIRLMTTLIDSNSNVYFDQVTIGFGR